ncbi:MAG: hypothetical protein ACE5LS_00110 [Thermoplasmata archaeon]
MSEDPFATALAWLEAYGILLVVDPRLPSVTTVVTGKPLRGSWWGHPRSHAIFAMVERLEGHAKALPTKLVSGKVTFVHRRLWPALAGVGSAAEPWQVEGLTPDEEALLARLGEAGWLRTDDRAGYSPLDATTVRRATKRLERKLLLVGREVHTETGAHARILETWEAWADRVGFRETWRTPAAGRQELKETLDGVNRAFGASGQLPWPRPQGPP